MRGDNFIYFSIVSGFFIGIIFAVLKNFSLELIIVNVVIIMLVFYIIALASVSFYIKFLPFKKHMILNKFEIDEILDMQIADLQKKENFILENYEFIKQIEEEERELIKKKRK